MSDQALLSDLCGICNIKTSKYKCPGCSARTCSLPCYKRHQQWAQCSGKRDPTKFVKKSQLATPAGIDHDFNFLTGIERDMAKAEKEFNDQDPPRSLDRKHSSRSSQPEMVNLAAAVGVTLIRAPKGLSRQKENKTHRVAKTKNVVWTIEWMAHDKSRVLTNVSSTCQVSKALSVDEAKPKKRKRPAEPNSNSKLCTTEDTVNAIEKQDTSLQAETNDKKPEDMVCITPLNTAQEEHEHEQLSVEPKRADDDVLNRPSENQFFLLRPRTSTSRHVVIPLTPSATLGECLRGRTVLEFPTIYTFPSSMTQLPEGFMLEEEYIKQEGEEQKEFEDMMKEVDPEILRRLKDERSDGEMQGEEVDSKKILDVLKQDLGSIKW
ncbi:hypothetical protein P153DRAFT_429843 [Dothidotthia symphoricarpi CBS 119687]|uniref:Box C/D snoRNA protein 1 n=1 Tax=Dothidotthia symphoricarpi CBS 119687 TaxID=1392245 RepID=A0A6A6AI02_9PLEO|nr:uncharacterized protein P153DRAFT_429843 [Dothidotthia symphoricarpi CBS 119687]KAF2131579.1 hypothetical protein P153DRAFT_429843 [Dothidotthia symphoricarpi CBS 119687]